MIIEQSLIGLLKISSESDATVLITGPTGTGKTTLARRIHDSSKRRQKPFVAINLATMHEGTLEAELFGYEKGAFTGADQRRSGRLELAQGGTVFLDEVGELPLRLQARLLDFLQSKTIVPLGSNREVRLDVRIIAATHRDLREGIKKGTFREDLFHRLRVVSIPLRSLVERTEDFDQLVHSCLESVCTASGRTILRITEEVAQKFEEYHWPGNIRELRHVLEYAVLAADNGVVRPEHLPSWFLEATDRISAESGPSTLDFTGDSFQSTDSFTFLRTPDVPFLMDIQTALSVFEKEYIFWALRRSRGGINRAARQIGMNKTTLLRRIKAYGLKSRIPDEKMQKIG